MSMNQKNKIIELGKAYKPHGIKGAVTFNLLNPNDSVLNNESVLVLKPESNQCSLSPAGEKFSIREIHFGNKVICYLKEIKDRTELEKILPFSIWMDRDLFPELGPDEFYMEDLVGLDVRNIDGEKEGVVKSFYDNGAQFVLSLSLNQVVDGSVKKVVLELPFIENFFPHVNLEQGHIVFINPEFDE